MAEEGRFPPLLSSQRLFHRSNPYLKSVKEAMIENLYHQTSPGGRSDDDEFTVKILVGFFCMLSLLLCCCFCGQHHSDEGQQDRQMESSTNSALTTTGDNRLDSAVPSSLPAFVYSTAHEGRLECSLCLTEFKDGDVGRFLPRCCHGFHKDCVDVWLNSHSTCPLCRSSVDFGTPDLAV